MSGFEVDARKGRAYRFPEPAWPERPISRRYSAIPCGVCGVPAGTACTGPRCCYARPQEALTLLHQDRLEELPEDAKPAPVARAPTAV